MVCMTLPRRPAAGKNACSCKVFLSSAGTPPRTFIIRNLLILLCGTPAGVVKVHALGVHTEVLNRVGGTPPRTKRVFHGLEIRRMGGLGKGDVRGEDTGTR